MTGDVVSDLNGWIADTDSSHHMTNVNGYFVPYKSFDTPECIVVGNQRTMMTYGCSNIRIKALVKGV